MKRLLLLRHAKAEPAGSTKDHARALAPRGEYDAKAMAAAMKQAGYVPDLVLCSTSARTRQTLALAAHLLGDPPSVYDDSLYLAAAKGIIKRVRDVGDDASTLMVVGHNPGLEEAAAALLARQPNSAELPLRTALATKFPTCALAVIDCPIAKWAQLEPGIGTLKAFLTPKSLA